MRGSAREFWRGLTTPTLGGWAASLAFAAFEAAAFCLWMTPARLAHIEPRYLMESTRDDYARVSVELAHFRHSRPAVPQVIYLGSSQAKWALTSWDDDALTQDISRRAGFEIDFHDVTTDLQHYEDALFIIDQLPPTFSGLALVAIDDHRDSPAEIGNVQRERWIGESSPGYDQAQRRRRIGRRNSGNFVVDHLKFFVSRRVAAVRIGLPLYNPYPPELGLRDADWADRTEREVAFKKAGKWRGPPPPLSNAAPMLREIVQRFDKRGITTVFVEPPRNPVRVEIEAQRIADYEQRMPLFAESIGAEYWAFDEQLGLRSVDFTDAIHVKSKVGRERFQAALFDKTVAWLKHHDIKAVPVPGDSAP